MHIARDIKPWHGVTFSRRCLDVSGSFVSSEHTILFCRTLEGNLFPDCMPFKFHMQAVSSKSLNIYKLQMVALLS